jgi:hypothetical protein
MVETSKVDAVIKKILKLVNKAQLNIPELISFYGRLGYALGASIAGIHDEGPTVEALKREGYRNPTVPVALMQQGLLVETWVEDYEKHPVLPKWYNETKKFE